MFTLVGAQIHESDGLDFAVSLPRRQSDELTVKYVCPILSGHSNRDRGEVLRLPDDRKFTKEKESALPFRDR